MKKITQFSLFFILFISLFQVDAQSFTQFRGLGADDSAEPGFKTISTNSVLVVSNNATGTTGSTVGSELFSKLTTAGGTDVITLKADGVNAVSFDVNDLSIFNYLDPASDADYTTNTKIVFKDAVGTPIRTMTLNSTKSLTSSMAGVSIGDFFDNNASLPVTGVSEIEITINPSTVSVDAFTIENITLSNIVSGAVPSGPATLNFNNLGITNTISNTLGKSTAIGPLNFEINAPAANDLITYKANEGAAGTGALYDNNADIGGITKWTISRHDGSEFTLSSIYLQEAGVGASTTGTLKARRNGVQVGSTVNVTFNGNIDVSANPDFTDIDEVWIEATDINFYLDNVAYVIPSSVVIPTVTTAAASGITATTVTLGGDVTDNGGATVTERGIVYNTSGIPTTADTKVLIGSGDGSFSDEITELVAETTYYVRAYAINSEGTSYGSEESFTTDAAPVTSGVFWSDDFEDATSPSSGIRTPSNNGGTNFAYFKRTDGSDIQVLEGGSVGSYYSKEGAYFWAGEDHDGAFGAGNELQTITWTGIDISGKSSLSFKGLFAANNLNNAFENAEVGFSHTDYVLVEYEIDGGVTQKLIEFRTNDPTGVDRALYDDTDFNGIGDGVKLTNTFNEFIKTIPITGNTITLRLKAYSNSGNEEWAVDNFRLETAGPSATLATVTTTAATGVTATTATLGGDVTDNGGDTVTERGIVYSTTTEPTTADTKVQIGDGNGMFSDEITGLTAGTTYYVRAYAINSEGTSYGSEESFSTSTLGLEEDHLKNAVSLYPNPVNDVLHLTNTIKVEKVVLFNVLGKRIDTIKMENNAINVSSLESGIYLLKIETENGNLIKRIIKE